MFLRPTEPLATGHFTFAEKASNFGIIIVEDFTQQENRPFDRLKLLQHQQERHRDRLFPVNALLRADYFESFSGDDRFWQPWTQVLFPVPVRQMQLIYT